MKEYTTLPPLSPDQSAESTLSESEKIKIQRQNLLILYQKARNLTINFQNQHDKFKTEEDILNSLRERYYDALCRKKFHESDRDIYFKQGDDLVDMRRQLLATSIDILTEQEAYYKASERYNNDILETLKFKDRNISNTERNFQDLQEAYEAIQERYSKQSTELCDVKADLNIEKVECQRLGKKIKNVEGKNEELAEKLDMEVAEKERYISVSERLEGKVKILEDKTVTLSAANEILENDRNDLEDKLSATVNKLTTTSESLSTLTKEHEDLHQKFTTSTSQNESMISELKTIVTDYQTEIKNYEKEVFNLKSKHKSSLIKIDEINKKLQVVTRARNNSVQSENKYKKANIETNERYQALLERAMGLIESDSNKNVQLLGSNCNCKHFEYMLVDRC